jgi:hypothetical protein
MPKFTVIPTSSSRILIQYLPGHAAALCPTSDWPPITIHYSTTRKRLSLYRVYLNAQTSTIIFREERSAKIVHSLEPLIYQTYHQWASSYVVILGELFTSHHWLELMTWRSVVINISTCWHFPQNMARTGILTESWAYYQRCLHYGLGRLTLNIFWVWPYATARCVCLPHLFTNHVVLHPWTNLVDTLHYRQSCSTTSHLCLHGMLQNDLYVYKYLFFIWNPSSNFGDDVRG